VGTLVAWGSERAGWGSLLRCGRGWRATARFEGYILSRAAGKLWPVRPDEKEKPLTSKAAAKQGKEGGGKSCSAAAPSAGLAVSDSQGGK